MTRIAAFLSSALAPVSSSMSQVKAEVASLRTGAEELGSRVFDNEAILQSNVSNLSERLQLTTDRLDKLEKDSHAESKEDVCFPDTVMNEKITELQKAFAELKLRIGRSPDNKNAPADGYCSVFVA